MSFFEIEAKSLKSKLKSDNSPHVIDVREEYEFEDGSITENNIPMSEILDRTNDLKSYDAIVLCCETGKRSKITAFHLDNKLENSTVYSLKGGLQAYNQSA